MVVRRWPLRLLTFGKQLTPVEAARDLGVILDTRTFTDHVTATVASSMLRLGHINRVKHCFDNRTLILIINALGFSNFITLLSPQSGLIRRNLTLPNSKLSRTLPVRLLAGPRHTTI